MHWTEPATADDSHAALEKKLWDAANMLWAGADLKPSEYSPTVLGLIFLRYADVRFAAIEKELEGAGTVSPSRPSSRRRKIGPTDYHAAGVIYLPENARFAELLKVMASVPMDKGGDTFGLIYEYFLGKFAMTEGQKGRGMERSDMDASEGAPEGWSRGRPSILHAHLHRRDPGALRPLFQFLWITGNELPSPKGFETVFQNRVTRLSSNLVYRLERLRASSGLPERR